MLVSLLIPTHSNFKHIFIRHYLPDSTRILCWVLYHALKQKITPLSHKVFFKNLSKNLTKEYNNYISYPPFPIPDQIYPICSYTLNSKKNYNCIA